MVEATGPDRRLRPGLQLAARDGQGATYRLRETAAGRYEAVIPWMIRDSTSLPSTKSTGDLEYRVGFNPRPGAPASRARYRLLERLSF